MTVASSSLPTGSSLPSPGTFVSAEQTVCLGHGLDASVDGLLSTIVLSSVIGLLLWLLFAMLRPRFRQVYGLREWFVPEEIRPKRLRPTIWAFLSPHVPLVPSIAKDVSDAGQSAAIDAKLFPSDEELGQRTLWHCLRVVLGWSILGLAGALPLYLVSTPCVSHSSASPRFEGVYSTLEDLSLMRLLRLLEDRNISTANGLSARAVIDGEDFSWKARVRIIILTALLIVVGILPALIKILKEFSRLVAFRRSWTDVHLQGLEMGWLSARDAPGFVGWGERRVKDFIVKSGLSTSFDRPPPVGSGAQRATGSRNGHSIRREGDDLLGNEREEGKEIEIQSLFSIGDTERLALLIEERDTILEHLEIAETKYVMSFRLSTPEPSIADFEPPGRMSSNREIDGNPRISRPKALGSPQRRRRRNPAFGSSSLGSTSFAPVSYVAPSQYYKLGALRGVDSEQVSANGSQREPSFSESVSQRVVGTRFQEVNRTRNSLFGSFFPLGSHLRIQAGSFSAVSPAEPEMSEPLTPIPDPEHYGPNYVDHSTDTEVDYGTPIGAFEPRPLDTDPTDPTSRQEGTEDDDWVDLMREAPIDFSKAHTPPLAATPDPMLNTAHAPGDRDASTFRFVRRPKIFGPSPSDRESVPLRRANPERASEVPPPHLRVQHTRPFVRPLTGFDHEELGNVYADIREWRTRLKGINQEVVEAQADAYNDIADGARIKGWLMVGRGLRYIRGVQLIEGRGKEDVRWDLLQGEDEMFRQIAFWLAVGMSAVLLAIGLTAAVGLALATSPNYAHYFTFLQPLADSNGFTTGLATVLAPAVAATLFISLAFGALHFASRSVTSVSVSGGQLLVVKTMFYLLGAVAIVWLIAAGAILYAFDALSIESGRPQAIADGSIYISILVLAILINIAIISPALLLLQPFRLRRVLRAEREAVTPRQRFRAVYPRSYNPVYALSCCAFAVVFASTFSVIFPLIGPAVAVLLFLTLVAQRFLVGYVYGRTRSQTGGLLQMWLLKRFGTVLAFQPLLMGLILLSRRLWPEGGTLVGVAVFIVVLVEGFAYWTTRLPGRKSLSMATQEALETFEATARTDKKEIILGEDESGSAGNSEMRATTTSRARGSFASVLDMMSVTLAVTPSQYQSRGPVPLPTETVDDLTATERAARAHPDAPPRLPPLSFAEPAEEMSSILYAPELVAPPPVIWLPNDRAGVAKGEVYDLQRYHDLKATVDVRAVEDARAPVHRLPL
ncbi:hypothetical protein OF83DRAFT_1170563 [Amylostereum chailletii]|nr:hypothetical protein OF83DRAFT_1170563 [Amylostereum chailletii]